jgi:hypothetical protein
MEEAQVNRLASALAPQRFYVPQVVRHRRIARRLRKWSHVCAMYRFKLILGGLCR